MQRSLPLPLGHAESRTETSVSLAAPSDLVPGILRWLHEIARALSLMHAGPFPNLAALRCAVLGFSSDGVWPDVARPLSTPCSGNVLLLYLQGSILQGYCNKKTLLSNHFGVHLNIGAFTVLSESSSHYSILALLLTDQSYLLACSTSGDEPPMACLPKCTLRLTIYSD